MCNNTFYLLLQKTYMYLTMYISSQTYCYEICLKTMSQIFVKKQQIFLGDNQAHNYRISVTAVVVMSPWVTHTRIHHHHHHHHRTTSHQNNELAVPLPPQDRNVYNTQKHVHYVVSNSAVHSAVAVIGIINTHRTRVPLKELRSYPVRVCAHHQGLT